MRALRFLKLFCLISIREHIQQEKFSSLQPSWYALRFHDLIDNAQER